MREDSGKRKILVSSQAHLPAVEEKGWDQYYRVMYRAESRFRSAIRDFCDHQYCKEIDQIAPTLRVGGFEHSWPEGVSHLRFSLKRHEVTFDIGIDYNTWRGARSDQEVVECLVRYMTEAFGKIVMRCKKEGFSIDERRLWSDWKKAAESLGVKIVVPPT